MQISRAAFGQTWNARQGWACSFQREEAGHCVRASGLLGLRVEPLSLLAEESRSWHPSWTDQAGLPSGTQNANGQPSRPGLWLATHACDAG